MDGLSIALLLVALAFVVTCFLAVRARRRAQRAEAFRRWGAEILRATEANEKRATSISHSAALRRVQLRSALRGPGARGPGVRTDAHSNDTTAGDRP